LLDFGIAKLYDAVARTGDETHTGVVLGTPSYMAPEQVGGGEVTDRTDVYAVGVLLFRLQAGRFPFEANSPREMMMRHLHARPAELPASPLARLVAQCLHKQPDERPRAAEVAEKLRALADEQAARPLELSTREWLAEPASAAAAAAGGPPTFPTRAEPP